MYDLAIIGGGPAGVAAGVYAARKRLKTVFIAEVIGGQSTDSVDIQNWIGTPHIPGVDLAKALDKHLREYAADPTNPAVPMVDLKIGERATKAEKTGKTFTITTSKGSYEARAILIATGGSRRKLMVPGAMEFENKGLTYCASCDGPLFAGQDAVVVGGGNAGFESAAQLLAYCKSVTLVHRSAAFDKADALTVEAVLKDPKMKALTNTEPVEIKGAQFVTGVVVKNVTTGEVSELPAGGVFVEIGMLPSTDFVKELVQLDAFNRVVTNPKNQHTSVDGVWAAGDCTDELYHQNNIAAGDGVKALEDIYFWLKANK
jgi:NADH-dependent peroxiredoxin subunit F